MKGIVIILILLILSFQSYCDKNSFRTDSNKVENLSKLENTSLQCNIEYKLLYENEKQYNDKILSTVYWALSSILVIILAIIGSNIFFNFRFNKKQYQELENELKQRLTNLENTIEENNIKNQNIFREKIGQVIHENRTEVLNRVLENKKELTSNLTTQIKDFSENVNNQIGFIQKIIDEREENSKLKLSDLKNSLTSIETELSEFREFIASHINEKITDLDKKISKSITFETNMLKLDIYNNEAIIWKLRGVEINALRYFIDVAQTHLKLGWKENIKYPLGDINETLKKCDYIYKSEHNDLKSILDETPDKFLEIKQDIKEVLNKIEIRE